MSSCKECDKLNARLGMAIRHIISSCRGKRVRLGDALEAVMSMTEADANTWAKQHGYDPHVIL